ncbi:MAG: molybdenum cofactor guanylyltransferase, partial [Armatimonadota bacterium]
MMLTDDTHDAAGLRICAAILAGGRASRYDGCPKGLLRLPGGTTIIENTLGAVAAAGINEVAIFANEQHRYHDLGPQVVLDRRPGLGPLGGIETALMHFAGRCGGVLVLPCDLPGLGHSELRSLLAVFTARRPRVVVAATRAGFWHPLCAIVRSDVLPAVSAALDSGNNGVYRLWRAVGAAPVYFRNAHPFFNVNTADDLDRWLLGEREPRRELKPT